jgi:hypothetical protein
VTDLRLTDPVDAAKALFDPVWIPWQVVVDEQMSALEIYALARRVSRHEDRDLRLLPKCLLRLAAALAMHTAVDRDDRLRFPEQRSDPVGQVVESVAVFREDDQLSALAGLVEHLCLAVLLTEIPWRYMKVPQTEFGKLHATELSEVSLVFSP